MAAAVWGPGFTDERLPRPPVGPAVGLTSIDHVVGNVEEGRLDEWVAFYESLGFSQMKHFDAEAISTQYSALRSTVMSQRRTASRCRSTSPPPGARRARSPSTSRPTGAPAYSTSRWRRPSIVGAVAALGERGVRFLDMPAAYYDDAKIRCARFDLAWDDLERLDIEVDSDDGGYLLQIFTETVTDRPTLFLEIIQREGATGFGEGNFKALFEAIEREQARRGNL